MRKIPDDGAKLRRLAKSIRRRSAGLRRVASACAPAGDRFALLVRADEADRCAAAIESLTDHKEIR